MIARKPERPSHRGFRIDRAGAARPSGMTTGEKAVRPPFSSVVIPARIAAGETEPEPTRRSVASREAP